MCGNYLFNSLGDKVQQLDTSKTILFSPLGYTIDDNIFRVVNLFIVRSSSLHSFPLPPCFNTCKKSKTTNIFFLQFAATDQFTLPASSFSFLQSRRLTSNWTAFSPLETYLSEKLPSLFHIKLSLRSTHATRHRSSNGKCSHRATTLAHKLVFSLPVSRCLWESSVLILLEVFSFYMSLNFHRTNTVPRKRVRWAFPM